MPKLYITRLDHNAIFPSLAYGEPAGIDLHCPCEVTIPPQSNVIIPIQIKITIQQKNVESYGRLASRSSLAIKNIIVINDIIDMESVKVILYNLSDKHSYTIKRKDRIAQVVFQETLYIPRERINVNDEQQRRRYHHRYNKKTMEIIKSDSNVIFPTLDLTARCYNVYSPFDAEIAPGQTVDIPSNVIMNITPTNFSYGKCVSTFHLAKENIIITNDTLISNNNCVRIVLHNLGKKSYNIKRGDHIARIFYHRAFDIKDDDNDDDDDDDDEYDNDSETRKLIFNSNQREKNLVFKKKNEIRAIFPYLSSVNGYCLCAPESFTIRKGQQCQIDTFLSVQIPMGYYGRIASSYDMSIRDIIVKGGVIDSDYNGNIIVVLHNIGKKSQTFSRLDCIGTFICEKIYMFHSKRGIFEERGIKGFGSSGR